VAGGGVKVGAISKKILSSSPISTYLGMDNKEAERVLKQHEKLIFYVAQPFFGQGVPKEDLIQEAQIALFECLKKWTEDGGASVWTFARPYVLGAMFKAVGRQLNEPSNPTRLVTDGGFNERGVDEVYRPNNEVELEAELSPSPEDLYIEAEERFLVREAIASLSPQDAELLALWMNSSSNDELGDRLGICGEAARQRVKHMINRVKDTMKGAA
jgi:RNA polymerase sigma factor (sigma-70 family)